MVICACQRGTGYGEWGAGGGRRASVNDHDHDCDGASLHVLLRVGPERGVDATWTRTQGGAGAAGAGAGAGANAHAGVRGADGYLCWTIKRGPRGPRGPRGTSKSG